MGLYIDMEMPKEIEPALVIDFCEDPDGKRYARFYHYRYGGLTDWHEVLEFHEPHGRLINADEFLKRAIGTKCFHGDIALMLEELVGESTTIIPPKEET